MFDREMTYETGEKFLQTELDGYFIDYIVGTKNVLVITFENAHEPHLPRPNALRKPWAADFLMQRDYCILGVKPKKVDWYRGKDLHSFFRSKTFKIFVSSFSRVVLYGSSMGGYAALVFAEACPGCTVIAFNPQSTLNEDVLQWDNRYPDGRNQDWSGDFSDARQSSVYAGIIYVSYDPFHDFDRRHIKRLNSKNIVEFKMPFVGHIVMSWMQEAGVLSKFVDHALSDKPAMADRLSLSSFRKKTPRYYLGLANKTKNANVVHACILKVLKNKLEPHHQRDFCLLIKEKDLWSYFACNNDFDEVSYFETATLFELLKGLSDAGFPSRAYEICVRRLRNVKREHILLVLASECLHRMGQLTEARTMALEATSMVGASGNSFRILARICYDLSELNEAIYAANRGIEVESSSILGWADLAKYYESMRQTDKSVYCLQQMRLLETK